MALSEKFLSAVAEKNKNFVRSAMLNSLLFDHSFQSFEEMKAHVEKHYGELLEDWDKKDPDEPFNMDRNSWDDNYLSLVQTKASRNFTKARIQHIQEIIKATETKAAPTPHPVENPKEPSAQQHPRMSNRVDVGPAQRREVPRDSNRVDMGNSGKTNSMVPIMVVGAVVVAAVVIVAVVTAP